MWAPSHDIAMRWLARGVRFFELTGEVELIRQAAFDLMRQFEDRKPQGGCAATKDKIRARW